MKKLFTSIIASFLLMGCASLGEFTPNAETSVSYETPIREIITDRGLPAVRVAGSTHKTYLMLSKYGTLDISGAPVKGKVSELFYDYTVIWEAEPGSPLPSKDEVKSDVPGATFRGWAYYDEDNDNVFPDYYETVPVKEGLALKAIFDGTSSGGGGGGGSSTATNVTFTITEFADWVPNDGAKVFVWSWGGGSGDGAWTEVTLSYLGENNAFHNVTGTFSAPNDITGFNIARCSSGTTLPDWTATGDSSGRVYNKTADVMVRTGVTSYTAPEFVEYHP
jgi:hypothetical protein